MDDTVMVSPVKDDSSTRSTSHDSGFDIVPHMSDSFAPPPSIKTACRADGDRHEQRKDIKELKNLREVRMKKELVYFDNEKIPEIIERIQAKKNLDREIETEIKNLEDMIKNKDNVRREYLIAAAETALAKMKETKQIANDGDSTLKRAMEIVQSVFPAFLSIWEKSKECTTENDQVDYELMKFEEVRHEVRQAGLDVDLRIEKSNISKQHIDNAIKFAEADVEKITKLNKREVEENRMSQCHDSKTEIDAVVESEIDMVDTWITTCKADKEKLTEIEDEQEKRQKKATELYNQDIKIRNEHLDFNVKEIEELEEKLRIKKEEAENRRVELSFQKQVQLRSQKLHDDLMKEMKEHRAALEDIQAKANTARKVVEKMSICGEALVESAMKAEGEFLKELSNLEIQVIEKLRDALAHSAIELRIKVDNATKNIDDAKDNMKVLKEKWQKAAERQNKLQVERNKKEYNEYKAEAKREKTLLESSQKELELLTEKMGHLEIKLADSGVEFKTLDELHELRLVECQEDYNDFNSLSSLDPSEDELSDGGL
ncbi:myosin heavy chain, clone 203-like [Clytia hemisphaerica]|uniref:Uncharacterized protein n=1 Tax=Clytia hemisphaerica TaxID=252671 RepID=A0A7M5U9L7_9CNID